MVSRHDQMLAALDGFAERILQPRVGSFSTAFNPIAPNATTTRAPTVSNSLLSQDSHAAISRCAGALCIRRLQRGVH